jgi:hypothetical protein
VAAPFFLQKLLNLEEDFYLFPFSFSDKKFEMLLVLNWLVLTIFLFKVAGFLILSFCHFFHLLQASSYWSGWYFRYNLYFVVVS